MIVAKCAVAGMIAAHMREQGSERQVDHSLEWIVELSATLVSRRLIGCDGTTAYARLMGKGTPEDVLKIRGRVLAMVARERL